MKLIKRTLAVIAVIVLAFVVFVQLSWNKSYSDTPYPDLKASTDSAMIARGRYLAYGPAHCATCHMPMDRIIAVEGGATDPLSGGWELSIPPGTFRAPNLTPHPTGIGQRTDAELARAMRHMVGHDGRGMMPFMPFQGLSDEDLVAVLSFLRSQVPVEHAIVPQEFTFMGKAILAMGLIKPEGPKEPPPVRVEQDSTAAYGHYLANYVANCVGCHTERDMKTGAFIGTPFAGGMYFEPDAFTEGWSYLSPNLTPHAATGVMADWDESTFVNRFKNGRLLPGSPMPWGAYSRMDTVDLKALYRYLKSLPPAENPIAKTSFKPGESMPE